MYDLFHQPLHKVENNSLSQDYLETHFIRLNKKCTELFNRLMNGERLTVLSAINSGISSLPRRSLDLKSKGIQLTDTEWIDNRYKVWFMTNDQIEFNKQLLKTI